MRLARILVPTIPWLLAARVVLAADARGAEETPLEQRVEGAIERGIAYLREQQDEDGAWDSDYGNRPGKTALALYALLASGVDRDDPIVGLALGELSRGTRLGTYDAACLLLALTACNAREHQAWIQELADTLVGWQHRAGDFAYPEGGADLSNTQFAALGLRAAAHAGIEIPDDVWERLARGTLDYALPDGSFAYSRSGRTGTDSMTAAGVGTLAICDERLSASGGLSSKLAELIRKRRTRGLAWLAKRSPHFVEPSKGTTSYYTLYGIERVGAFEEIELIGGDDWYRIGAADLCTQQAPDGGWSEGNRFVGDSIATSFALLFLRRATRTSVATGEAVARRSTTLAVEDPAADVRFVANGKAPTSFWITGFGPRVREQFEWAEDKGQGPRVAHVSYLADGIAVAEVEGDPERPAGRERFAARYAFPEARTYRVRARVVVLRPPHVTESGRILPSTPAVLLSPELEYVAEDGVVQGRRPGRRPGRNLLAGARPRLEASSFVGVDGTAQHPPEHAVDGLVRTSWVADPVDDDPTFVIRLRKVLAADRVLVSNARSLPYRPGYYARATQVEIRVNDGRPELVAMPPDERESGKLELPPGTPVRKLELRLLWPVAGEQPSAGLCEVELVAD